MITYHNTGVGAVGTHTTYSWMPQTMFTTLITATSAAAAALAGAMSALAQLTQPADIT